MVLFTQIAQFFEHPFINGPGKYFWIFECFQSHNSPIAFQNNATGVITFERHNNRQIGRIQTMPQDIPSQGQ
ncbi:MAG TPA: hypothetical protein DCX07_07410 [Phycisphaerales bacterium]|nr:hypothetical protein [Phycisphaerales bacterium]